MPVVEVVIAAVAALASGIQAVGQSKVSFWDPRSRKGSLDKVVTNLKTARDNLKEMKIDFENDVTLGSYMDWPRKVRRIQNEMSNLVAQYENAQGSRRSDFTKGLNKLHKIVEDVIEEGNKIIEVMSQPPEPYKARDITIYPTLQRPFEDILGWLDSDSVKGIGIHGAVGSGKTNIMFNLVKHEKVVPKFDVVIWLAVSREANKENLSRDCLLIALSKKLKLDVRDITSLVEVTKRVSDALKEKKYLLLLDDVKENIDLIELGIPSGKPGSKVVLTTRNRHVCNSLVNQAVKVSFLEDKEAQEMFREVVADSRLDTNENIKWVARRVCKECYGVPLYIDKVASTFKLKMKEELWTEALSKLRYWPEKEYEGIREVYRTLRFCYDDLDDDRKKRCFLYGVLYPEGENIETGHLLECWEAEEFLGKEARRHGHDVLNHLTNVSLLEEGEKENHVTMHSFIRQMALHVAESENPPLLYLVQTSSGLDLAPTVETWKEMSGISFANNSLEQLPESPSCSKLSTLFLNKNEELKEVSPSFFEHAKDLRVLDLSETGIQLLPSSAAKLRKLKNLYLNDCKHLKELPAKITNLQKLETLDIRRTGFCQIPPVVETLIGLRRLRVSLTMSTSINANPQGTFSYSKLCALEELVIDVEPTVTWSMALAENILKEVASLNKLRILKVKTGDTVVDVINVIGRLLLRISMFEATILQIFIEKQLRKEDRTLRPFWVLIGCESTEKIKLPDEKYIERYVRYRNGAGNTFPAAKVLAVADCFELLDHAEIKQLSDFGTMKCIKYCVVENCNVLETIVGGSTTEIVLPVLEDLYVKQLPKLASIFTGQLLRGSLAKLQTLVFTECADLKLIFALGTTKQLGSIQHLEIESCAGMVEVIVESEAVGNQKLLPKLKKLILRDMPALTTICKVDSLEWASLEELEISECPLLCDFPFNTNNAKKLKVIKGDQGCRDAINKLSNQQVKDRLLKVAVAGP